ncbi:WD repeat-containing protein 91-like isoform X1 [Homarus americanus]|uniref:WD repeat-containing protein 91 n=2 Tax=Homarus americanus TaxID=6706 RepID=A0A8J5TKK2_HOMAM|nr:WD repeat-containing protein 91-like isoform X1 [Homarus americanus]KAG7176280.1 WD repeat-containing protein 91-like [Homarus americanus]
MSHIQYLDELVKEYLLFRGFSHTLRSLDNELKIDKDKGFRVDRLVDQVLSSIQTYDLIGLRELWAHLDRRIFARLPHTLLPCVRKLETSILRLYVINTIQTNKPDKLVEFFEKMAPDLQSQSEWREWFILPYLKGVEENPSFAMYFTRQWQDTLLVSLHNFLAVVFQSIELPTLASYRDEASKIARLQEENELLRVRLAALTTSDQPTLELLTIPDPPPPQHLMDDFYNIAQEAPSSDNQLKSLKTILFGLGGGLPTSPILGRRGAGGAVTASPQPSPSAGPATPSSNQGPSSSSGHPVVRRTSSQAPAEEKKRMRSSSVASMSSSRNSGEHIPVKRLVQSTVSSTRPSRSPTKIRPQDESTSSTKTDITSDKGSFLLLGQEGYYEHRAVVTHAVFNPSGTLVASADIDGVVKLWSPSPFPKTHCGVVVKSAVTAVEWLPRGERFLLIATKAATLRLFDTRDKKTVWEIGPDTCPVLKDQRIMGVRMSPGEGNAVVSVAPRVRPQGTSTPPAQPALHTIDMKSLKVESSYRIEGGVVNGCIMNHNGGLLVCGCNDGSMRIIDLRCPDVIASWPAHQGEVFTVRLSPQENNIYTIGSDNRFACWSMAQTGARVMDHVLHERAAGPFLVGVGGVAGSGRSVLLRPYGPLFALHQDGEHVLTCSSTGPIVYKVGESSLEQALVVGGHKSPIVTVDWCNALQCGTSVAAALDGSVTVATLMHQ